LNKVVYISDYFASQILGGGELNDDELLNQLSSNGVLVEKINSSQVKSFDINSNDKFIISNFVNLNRDVINKLITECSYVIYEHDHKYLKNRNPAVFDNFKAPKDFIVNKDFYENAVKVLCQSSFHKSIVEKNIEIKNIYNISGNLWSDDSINLMSDLSYVEKKDCYSIIDSNIDHKNTYQCVNYCKLKKLNFELISSRNYLEFLSKLSKNDKLLFLPKTPETLSRIVVEAKMMGVKVVTNKNVGATHEPWFNKNGKDLIDVMKNRKETIPLKILEFLNEQ